MAALTQLARDYRAAWHDHVQICSEVGFAHDHYQAKVKPLENAIAAHPYPVSSCDELLQLALIMSDELADLSNSVMTLRIIEMVRACAEARGADNPDPIMSLITAYDAALNYAEEVSRAAEDMSDADYAELSAKTHLPLREALINSTEAATTAEGARAALNLARREYAIGEPPFDITDFILPRPRELLLSVFVGAAHTREELRPSTHRGAGFAAAVRVQLKPPPVEREDDTARARLLREGLDEVMHVAGQYGHMLTDFLCLESVPAKRLAKLLSDRLPQHLPCYEIQSNELVGDLVSLRNSHLLRKGVDYRFSFPTVEKVKLHRDLHHETRVMGHTGVQGVGTHRCPDGPGLIWTHRCPDGARSHRSRCRPEMGRVWQG